MRSPCVPVAPSGASQTQRSGFAAEQVALDYLLSRGLRLVARNFRVRLGELDLVMADGDQLVFVEVRSRASTRFGGAAASVTPAKQRRVRRAAQAFLGTALGARTWPASRFDVVAIEGTRIDWIPGAF
jgi:putative endonuclease